MSRFALAFGLVLSVSTHLSAAYNWGSSGLVGAGTQNCLAIQPGGTGVMVSAADISGFQRSTDYGVHWRTCNVGTPIGGPSKVACVIFSNNPSTPNTVYGGTGNEGAGGGFLASTDAGQTWTLRSTVPQFSGNGESSYPGLPNRWPRSTGNLIALDETGATKYIYAGTFRDGVMRSTDGGNTWALVGIAGKLIRSIAIDPNAPWKIFATDYSNGIWYCNAARGTTNTGTGTTGWTHLAGGAPDTVEEMVFVGSTLYAAGKNGTTGGVWKSTDSGTTWTRIGATDIATSSTWTAIAGYNNGTSDILYIGATDPVLESGDGNYRNILKSTNGGTSWTPVTLSANIVNEIGGAGGPPWWMALTGGGPYVLGRAACDLANIQIDPTDRNKVFVSGRGGIWGTTNATAGSTSVRWYPMIGGLMVTVGEWVATDPNIPGRVYVGNEDWIFFYSADFGTTFRRNASGMSHGNTSRTIYVDPTDSKVYCGTLDDAGTNGNLYSHADPTLGTAWTDENLAPSTGSKNLRGCAAVHNGATRYLLAAVEGSGLWRKSGSTWSLVSSAINPSGAVTTTFAWRPGTPYVFVYEKGTGLWRSTDYGATWTKIWATTSSATGSGFVVANPNVTGELYVSVATGVFRFTGAQAGTPVPTDIGGPANPGAIAYANGALYACDIVSSSHNGRLYKWDNPSTSATNAAISDTIDYPGQSGWPTGLAVDPNGMVHVSNRGNSVMSGATDVLFSDDFEDGNSTGWTAETGTWSVVTDGTKVYQVSSATGGASHAGNLAWTDYAVQADVKVLSLGTGAIGISARYQDFNNRYFVIMNGANQLALKKSVGGTQTTLSSVAFTAVNGSTYTLKLVVNGTTIEAYLNGVLQMSVTDTSFSSGQIAAATFNATAEFDNVVVNSTN